MPIQPMRPVLQAEILQALSFPIPLEPVVALGIIKGVVNLASAGVFPTTPPTPIIPAGFAPAFTTLFGVLKLKPPDKSITAQGFATAIQLVAPQVPPTGLAALRQAIENTLRKDPPEPQLAAELAGAITNYYLAGGVI